MKDVDSIKDLLNWDVDVRFVDNWTLETPSRTTRARPVVDDPTADPDLRKEIRDLVTSIILAETLRHAFNDIMKKGAVTHELSEAHKIVSTGYVVTSPELFHKIFKEYQENEGRNFTLGVQKMTPKVAIDPLFPTNGILVLDEWPSGIIEAKPTEPVVGPDIISEPRYIARTDLKCKGKFYKISDMSA